MIKDLEKLRRSIDGYLTEAIQLVETEPTRAMDKVDSAKALLHELSYKVWMRHHTSGRVGK
jgi:hypothetical protein